MTETIEALRDGDIYRWGYRDPKTNSAPWGDYHCCSRVAIVKHGRLYDTYWQTGQSFSGCKSFGPDDLPKLTLERLGNMAELEAAKEYQADYYDDADIVDLNHSNNTRGNFYLRKDAKRSRDKMEAIARQRFAEAESDFHTARRRMDEIGKIIDRIEAGDIDMHIPSWR